MADGDDVYMAKLTEQAEDYELMVKYMNKVATNSMRDLTLEERNLLSVAYKNVVGACRAKLRIIGSIETKAAAQSDGDKLYLIHSYRSKVETELNTICNDILGLLESSLIRTRPCRRRATSPPATRPRARACVRAVLMPPRLGRPRWPDQCQLDASMHGNAPHADAWRPLGAAPELH